LAFKSWNLELLIGIYSSMRVFKFGGASVKDAAGIKNVYDVYKSRLRSICWLFLQWADECTRNCHKNYFDKSAELNSSVQEVKNTTIKF
jgi:aspartate kinase